MPIKNVIYYSHLENGTNFIRLSSIDQCRNKINFNMITFIFSTLIFYFLKVFSLKRLKDYRLYNKV